MKTGNGQMARGKVADLASRLPVRSSHSSSPAYSQPSIIIEQSKAQMKRKYDKPNDEFKGSSRPRSRQRVLATPERSHRSSQEPAATHDHEVSTVNSVIASQAAIVPIQVAPAFGDANSVFDKLRGAMDGGDASLFGPIQIALDDLVKIGHSKVSSLDLT